MRYQIVFCTGDVKELNADLYESFASPTNNQGVPWTTTFPGVNFFRLEKIEDTSCASNKIEVRRQVASYLPGHVIRIEEMQDVD